MIGRGKGPSLACFLALVLFAGWLSFPASAARLEPEQLELGGRARLHLEVAPADSTEWPVGLGVVVSATEDPLVWSIIAVRVGDLGVAIPSEADTLKFVVAGSIEQAAPERLRPLWSVDDLGPNWWPTILVALLVLLPLLIWLARRFRRAAAVEAPFTSPAEPPHVVALRRLEEIEASGLLRDQRFEPFYVEASHALRAYIGGRFRVPALDWTSSEVVERLTEAGYESGGLKEVDPLLRGADEVKFAAHQPSEHQAQEWLREARNWIEATAIEPVYSTPEAVMAAEAFNAGGGR